MATSTLPQSVKIEPVLYRRVMRVANAKGTTVRALVAEALATFLDQSQEAHDAPFRRT